MFDLIFIGGLMALHLFTDLLKGGGPGLCFLWCVVRVIWQIAAYLCRGSLREAGYRPIMPPDWPHGELPKPPAGGTGER